MTMIRDGNGNVINEENPLNTKVESASMLPVDIQSRLASTIQTHNAVSVGMGSSSDSVWFDADGFDKLAITMKNDASTTCSADVHWSHDGVNRVGYDISVAPSNTQAEKSGIIDIRARYYKIRIINGDGALAHTMSAWAYLKA